MFILRMELKKVFKLKFNTTIVIAILLVLTSQGYAAEKILAPRYNWVAFNRFWNVNCVSGCEIIFATDTDEGKTVIFADNVRMLLSFEKDYIRKVSIIYATQANYRNGQLFVKLVESALKVGAYRWSEERKADLHKTMLPPSNRSVSYEWQTSNFSNNYIQNQGWEFSLEFVNR